MIGRYIGTQSSIEIQLHQFFVALGKQFLCKDFTIKARCREDRAFWRPDACRQAAEPEYLVWLREQGEKTGIGKDGRIIIDEAYLRDGQSGMMTQQ